jgi:ABC-type molybdate transport system permease subunit
MCDVGLGGKPWPQSIWTPTSWFRGTKQLAVVAMIYASIVVALPFMIRFLNRSESSVQAYSSIQRTKVKSDKVACPL